MITSERTERSTPRVLTAADRGGFSGQLGGERQSENTRVGSFPRGPARPTEAQLANEIYDLGLMAGAESWWVSDDFFNMATSEPGT